MTAAIVCVGRLREKGYAAAAEEYMKRLSRYGKTEIIELPDLPEPANASDADRSQVMEKEGQRRCKEIRAEATSARALGSPAASSFLWTQEGSLSLLLRGNSFAANQGVFGETYSR